MLRLIRASVRANRRRFVSTSVAVCLGVALLCGTLLLGDTVRYAFVCDPDGNHIEISQRASLTGGRL